MVTGDARFAPVLREALNQVGGTGTWGSINGTLSDQTDLQSALDAKISSIGDPGADRILFWDDSAGAYAWLTAGTGLSITSTTLTATGDVTKVGTPVNNQVGVWTGDGTIEGTASLTFDTSTLSLGSGAAAGVVQSVGNFDLTLQTGNATTGTITITDGANGNITIDPNGSGQCLLEGSTQIDSTGSVTTSNADFIIGAAGRFDSSDANVQLGGASQTASSVMMGDRTSGSLAVGASYGRLVIGTGSITEAASGTHPLITSLGIKPVTVTGGVATLTNTATLYVESAITATVTGNNYALWADSGVSRFDGAVHLEGATGIMGILDASSVATSNKTFTFPNATGALSVATSGVGIYKTIYKSADETVNNSDVLQNDDALLFAVAANEVWAFTIVCLLTSNSTADFKAGWSVPTAATMKWTNAFDNTMYNESQAYSYGTATDSIAEFYGTVFVGANAGNVTFQWAQNTATVVDTKVLKGSYIIAHRLA